MRISCVRGGDTRQASVRAGLEAVDAERVVIHDGARPFARPDVFRRAITALEEFPAAVAAVPIEETVKRVAEGQVLETLDRDGLWRIQTPQAFRTETLAEAHAAALEAGVEATDDAALVERIGGTVAIVPGARYNLKVTYPEDLALAEALVRDHPFPLAGIDG